MIPAMIVALSRRNRKPSPIIEKPCHKLGYCVYVKYMIKSKTYQNNMLKNHTCTVYGYECPVYESWGDFRDASGNVITGGD